MRSPNSAPLRTGGKPLDSDGAYYPATVLTDVLEGAPVVDEETFGPGTVFIEVASDEAAIELANDT